MTDPFDKMIVVHGELKETRLRKGLITKAELRAVYEHWRAEEIEAIELIEAVAKYLGDWK